MNKQELKEKLEQSKQKLAASSSKPDSETKVTAPEMMQSPLSPPAETSPLPPDNSLTHQLPNAGQTPNLNQTANRSQTPNSETSNSEMKLMIEAEVGKLLAEQNATHLQKLKVQEEQIKILENKIAATNSNVRQVSNETKTLESKTISGFKLFAEKQVNLQNQIHQKVLPEAERTKLKCLPPQPVKPSLPPANSPRFQKESSQPLPSNNRRESIPTTSYQSPKPNSNWQPEEMVYHSNPPARRNQPPFQESNRLEISQEDYRQLPMLWKITLNINKWLPRILLTVGCLGAFSLAIFLIITFWQAIIVTMAAIIGIIVTILIVIVLMFNRAPGLAFGAMMFGLTLTFGTTYYLWNQNSTDESLDFEESNYSMPRFPSLSFPNPPRFSNSPTRYQSRPTSRRRSPRSNKSLKRKNFRKR